MQAKCARRGVVDFQCAHSVGVVGVGPHPGSAGWARFTFPSGKDGVREGDDQLPHAPDVTVTSTVVADRSLVTTSRVAPADDVALPPVTLVQYPSG